MKIYNAKELPASASMREEMRSHNLEQSFLLNQTAQQQVNVITEKLQILWMVYLIVSRTLLTERPVRLNSMFTEDNLELTVKTRFFFP